MNYDDLTALIRRLALEAGDRIMEVYNGPDFEVKAKSDASPVTEADEAADRLISAGLRAAIPTSRSSPKNRPTRTGSAPAPF